MHDFGKIMHEVAQTRVKVCPTSQKGGVQWSGGHCFGRPRARTAVERGDLSEERYASYFKHKKESDFYGMSYEENRKKDKAFGRFIKTVKEQMKD
jgi:hypothetical protein